MDAAVSLNDAAAAPPKLAVDIRSELEFAASFFDAYLESRFDTRISEEVTLLASASYFLGQRPGSSLVLARRLQPTRRNAIEQFAIWVLRADWRSSPDLSVHPAQEVLSKLVHALMHHFFEGAGAESAEAHSRGLRKWSYANGSPREIVLAEVAAAVIRMRLASSAWTLLPAFSGLESEAWSSAIRRAQFPKELWPSQQLLGQAGVFAGRSGVIQMPTSAGKTRSVEIILRSAFLANRTRAAVLVAPFRALCHEIATSLRKAFRGDDVKVNELSDVLQLDFVDQIAELFGASPSATRHILVLTPEKLLYALRQTPNLAQQIGLVVYDEGHQFDSGARGITYELLVTEIKRLVKAAAQTVLISAVIKNAAAVGSWLIGADPNVVDGTGLLSTARSVAFATWSERLGQLLFFESNSFRREDYFVPRSIEAQSLKLRPNERNARRFPEKGRDAWKDVSLYLGIRLAPNGAVAIFCGRKDTASGLAERATEVYSRGFSLPPPIEFSNEQEVARLVHLASQHFGQDSPLARAAALGVFIHHGTTPQGLRLSVEYAMQNELIKLVICTSTLAQGVNLPIRYLIVSGVNQGADRIRARDFQNLIGRAGRAGMHTEGLVVFADPRVMDNRRTEAWRLENAVGLLKPESTEDTSSSLLTLVSALSSADRRSELPIPISVVQKAYFLRGEALSQWASNLLGATTLTGESETTLARQIEERQSLLAALESYLMANRGEEASEDFSTRAKDLAQSTLAFALGNSTQKEALVELFQLTAQHIQAIAPEQTRQAKFSKTLLPVVDAATVEQWVLANATAISRLSESDGWLTALWPLLIAVSKSKLLTDMEPDGLALRLAWHWIRGASYRELVDLTIESGGTKAWGRNERRRLSEHDVLGFVEGCLGYDCQLVIGAVGEFMMELETDVELSRTALDAFQKRLKYGLSDELSIAVFDSGFADRVIAQDLATALRAAGYKGTTSASALTDHRIVFVDVLDKFPSYFATVLDGL